MNRHYATFIQRLIAFIIDNIFMILCSIPFYFLLKGSSGSITFYQATLLPRLIITIIYNTYMISHGGATFGKRALKIKVIREDGGILTTTEAFLREFLGKAVLGVFLIGYLWMLIDKNKQCWQDKVGGTVVVVG